MMFLCKLCVAEVVLLALWVSLRAQSESGQEAVCPKPRLLGRGRDGWRWLGGHHHQLPHRYFEDVEDDSASPILDMTESPPPSMTCVKDGDTEPPDDITSFTTSLLHERDVMHYMTWKGELWQLGKGSFAEVHMGRLVSSGQCVVIKQFTDSSLSTIEGEITNHRYIEEFLPNTPRLIGVLPAGTTMENFSLVYQLVPGSHTLHDWLRYPKALSALQWLSVALQITETMDRLHRRCVLHNDFHSANVLLHVEEAGQTPDADCGISRFQKHADDAESRLSETVAKLDASAMPIVTFIDFGHATFRRGKIYTRGDRSLASFKHLAPELCQQESTTRASDVYSVGRKLLKIAKAMNHSIARDIASQCMDTVPENRPPLPDVVHRLRLLLLKEIRSDTLLQKEICPEACAKYCPNSLCTVHQSFLRPSIIQPLKAPAQTVHDRGQGLTFENSNASRFVRIAKVGSLHNSQTMPCFPRFLEMRMSELTLPYIPMNGDVSFETDEEPFNDLFQSEDTVILHGWLRSSGEHVAVKRIYRKTDFFAIRFEAMVNLYLNETGWVPKFYGVVPLHRYKIHRLGLVQELFADGETLEDVLTSERPAGVRGRVRLALQLTSMIHDVHSRHMLINNLKWSNVLCACANETECSDVKLIDLDKVTGCEGRVFDDDPSNLDGFVFLAPEVRHNRRTSFASDVYGLCVILDVVLSKEEVLYGDESEEEYALFQSVSAAWTPLLELCLSEDPSVRPSTFQLIQLFSDV